MKRVWKDSLSVVIVVLLLVAASCTETHTGHNKEVKQGLEFTCPMHPQVLKNESGSCPICGMKLVPKARPSADPASKVRDSLSQLTKPANAIVISDIRTIKPQRGLRFADVSFSGRINYNTGNWHSISSRVSGRIEKLYVKYNYQQVSKGQKLMEVYSPDLVSAQQELIFLKRSKDDKLLEAARNKLGVLGATNSQISQILKTEKVQGRMAVYSPFSGYVSDQWGQTESTASSSPAAGSTLITSESNGSSMSAMSGSTASATPPAFSPTQENASLNVREGQYIGSGQKVFNLIDPSTVWVEFFVAPDLLKYFKRGTGVHVRSTGSPSKGTSASVSLIQPYYNEGVRFSLIRATLKNTDAAWKVGQLVEVKGESAKRTGNWIPRTAVVQLGSRYAAFVKDNGVFRPVYVSVSARAGNWADIGNSLPATVELAENAWFLVDTESFIKPERI